MRMLDSQALGPVTPGLVLLLAALVMVAPGPAAGRSDAPWSEPVAVPVNGSIATLSIDDSGGALTTWQTSDAVVIAGRAPGGPFQVTVSLPGLQVTAAPDGRTSVLLLLNDGRTNRGLHAVRVGIDGRVKSDTLITSGASFDVHAAANRRGVAMIVWIDRESAVRARVRARAGSSFGAPLTLAAASAHAGGVGAAVSSAGELAVLWADAKRPRRTYARIRAAGRQSFSRPTAIGSHDGVADIQAGYDSAGRLYAAWGSHDGGEEVNLPLVVHGTSRAPGAGRFDREQSLDRSSAPGLQLSGRLWLAPLAPRGAAIGWSAPAARTDTFAARAAAADAHGRFGAKQTLDGDAVLGGLAAGPRGVVVASWSRPSGAFLPFDEGVVRLVAGVRSAAGVWGAAELVAPIAGAGSAVAFDSRGTAAVAWSTAAGGQFAERRIGR